MAIIIASLTLLGLSTYLRNATQAGSNTIAAKVNDTLITKQQVLAIASRLQPQPSHDSNLQAVQRDVVEKLIQRALLVDIAKHNGFEIDQEERNRVIADMPAFQVQGHFSQARFEALTRQLGYAPAVFIASVEADLLSNQLQNALVSTEFALPDEALSAQQWQQQTRDLSYAHIAFDDSPQVTIADAQAKRYYQTHLDTFKTPAKIQLDYLTLSAKAIAATLQPSTAQLQQFYQQHLDAYTQAKKWHLARFVMTDDNPAVIKAKLAQLTQALTQQNSFAALAKQFADDPDLADTTLWQTDTDLPLSIRTAIDDLQVGDISQPIAVPHGYQIIKVLAIKPAQTQAFKQVTKQVRCAYVREQARQQFAESLQELTDLTFQHPDSLVPAATALNLKIRSSDWLTRNNAGLFAQPNIVRTAFSRAVRQGNNSKPVYPDAHTAVVMRVKQYQAGQVQSFAQVKSRIKAQLALKARQEQAQQKADAITTALNNGQTVAQVADHYGLTWTTLNAVNRHAPPSLIDPLVLQTAFNLPSPRGKRRVSATHIRLADQAAIEVIAVRGVHTPTVTDSTQAESTYGGLLQHDYNALTLFELIHYYRKQADVKTY